MTLTVPEAARRIGRNPETVRRWIREGKLPSTKVGTQHLIDERHLADLLDLQVERTEASSAWPRTFWGDPMPDVVAALRRSRAGH